MAIVAPAAVTVTTTSTLVFTATTGSANLAQTVVLSCPAGNTVDVLVGGTAAGALFPIAPGGSLAIDCRKGDEIYADCSAGTETLNIIYNMV